MVQFPSFLTLSLWVHLGRQSLAMLNDLLKAAASSLCDWTVTHPFGSTFIFLSNEEDCQDPALITADGLMAESPMALKPSVVLDLPPKPENKWAATGQRVDLSWYSETPPGSSEPYSLCPSWRGAAYPRAVCIRPPEHRSQVPNSAHPYPLSVHPSSSRCRVTLSQVCSVKRGRDVSYGFVAQ